MVDDTASAEAQLTVLMVDDEQIVLDSARKLLSKEPLRFVTAQSAAEGLTLLEAGGIQVVLTDLKMPAMNDLEFTERVKERWPTIPVVMVTGYATIRTLGRNSWMMMQTDGTVLMGVEMAFVKGAGAIQDIDLPRVGDVLRQGAVCLQIFSTDLNCHTVWSPLSGEVVEVNQGLLDDPATALQDPYGEGWLLRIAPSNFDAGREVLGL